MADSIIDAKSLTDLKDIERAFASRVPRSTTRAVARGMVREGAEFKRAFRREAVGNFKTGGNKVANAIRFYVAGDQLHNLRLGVFTRWEAAPLYELGGSITPSEGNWLIFPVTPRAYTAAGRVKRSWRDPNNPKKFRADLFEGLRAVKIKGGWLLVRDRGVSASGRVGKVTKRRGIEAVEPIFRLIKKTERKPQLRFIDTFEGLGSARNKRLERAAIKGIEAGLLKQPGG